MKKLLSILLLLLLLSACTSRKDYYILSFDTYSLTPGYDDMEFVKLVFDFDIPEQLDKKQSLENIRTYFWDTYFADISIYNPKNKVIDSNEAILTRVDIFLDNNYFETYKINDIELSSSVKQNCEMFKGEFIERNGYACVIGQVVNNHNNVIILSGDYLGIDQDELSRIEVFVE